MLIFTLFLMFVVLGYCGGYFGFTFFSSEEAWYEEVSGQGYIAVLGPIVFPILIAYTLQTSLHWTIVPFAYSAVVMWFAIGGIVVRAECARMRRLEHSFKTVSMRR